VDESLRYSHPESMDRAPAEAILWSNDPAALCETLVSVALHDPSTASDSSVRAPPHLAWAT